jgi:hypothetical protein
MLTMQQVKDEVVRLAKEYPNAVYCKKSGSCHNFLGGVKNGPDKEGCIVGQAFSNLREFSEDEKDDYSDACSCDMMRNFCCDFEETSNLSKFVLDVQFYQDIGWSWGESVKLPFLNKSLR